VELHDFRATAKLPQGKKRGRGRRKKKIVTERPTLNDEKGGSLGRQDGLGDPHGEGCRYRVKNALHEENTGGKEAGYMSQRQEGAKGKVSDGVKGSDKLQRGWVGR